MTPRSHILAKAKQSLNTFLASSASFQVVHSVSSSTAASTVPKTLFILDSSFNPPSIAHASLATSALRASHERYATPHRLLLLFSVHNADKSPAPAAFEQRLAMMMAFAEDMAGRIAGQMAERTADIDIGLTTKPYYNDKSTAIEEAKAYAGSPQHIHLVGYDTFVRIFEAKYYSGHTPPLSALAGFFRRHGLRITLRPEEKWGGLEEQAEFWQKLARGEMEADGGKREWAERIEVVKSDDEGVGVSSTCVREAVARREWATAQRMCTRSVVSWVEENKLYASAEADEQ